MIYDDLNPDAKRQFDMERQLLEAIIHIRKKFAEYINTQIIRVPIGDADEKIVLENPDIAVVDIFPPTDSSEDNIDDEHPDEHSDPTPAFINSLRRNKTVPAQISYFAPEKPSRQYLKTILNNFAVAVITAEIKRSSALYRLLKILDNFCFDNISVKVIFNPSNKDNLFAVFIFEVDLRFPKEGYTELDPSEVLALLNTYLADTLVQDVLIQLLKDAGITQKNIQETSFKNRIDDYNLQSELVLVVNTSN